MVFAWCFTVRQYCTIRYLRRDCGKCNNRVPYNVMAHTNGAVLEPRRLSPGSVDRLTAAPFVMDRKFLDGAQRVQSAPDPDEATAQTVAIMCSHINKATRDPLVQRVAADALKRWNGGPVSSSDPNIRAAGSAWWEAHSRLTFVHHDPLIRMMFGESDQLQLLIAPDVLLRMKEPAGDCAIYTMLVCALLKRLRVPYEVVTAAVDPSQPQIFSHVYARAIASDGSRIPLDASHGQYPGWEVPQSHISRKQVWNEHGDAIADAALRFKGLHGYVARRGRRRGMGDDSTTLNFPFTGTADDVQGGGTYYPPSDPNPTQIFTTNSGGGGFNWGSFFGGLANQWTQIGARVIAPTTTIQRGPNGQVLIQTPASGSNAAIGTSVLGSGVGSSSSLFWVGGLVVAGIFVMSMAKGKG